MVNTVDGNRQLEGSLHYDPAAYWCPQCCQFTKNCPHLVPALKTRLVALEDWLIRAVRYDRERKILEVRLHAAGTYQHFGVSLELALKLVRSPAAGKVYQDTISGNFPFKRVRSSAFSVS